eukprot:jgi/Chrzof1/4136/Cz14g00140.t1
MGRYTPLLVALLVGLLCLALAQPIDKPTRMPKEGKPTRMPKEEKPTSMPVEKPTRMPKEEKPTSMPVEKPTRMPKEEKPTRMPVNKPTRMPKEEKPTRMPVEKPTRMPKEEKPTRMPVEKPTRMPKACKGSNCVVSSCLLSVDVIGTAANPLDNQPIDTQMEPYIKPVDPAATSIDCTDPAYAQYPECSTKP